MAYKNVGRRGGLKVKARKAAKLGTGRRAKGSLARGKVARGNK